MLACHSRILCQSSKSLAGLVVSNKMKMTLGPKESGDYITKNAKHLTVHPDGIKKLAKEVINALTTKELDIKNFSQNTLHPSSNDVNAPNWIFLIDTLNFCFWTFGNATKWTVNGHTGYFGLCAAINRAISDGVDITNPSYYSNITVKELENILRSDDGITKCPLIAERVQCLHEVGKKLLTDFDGNFKNCLIAANRSAQKLIEIVISNFPCYRDETQYGNEKVAIYKRVQILVGDIWACYEGSNLGQFDDINTITMFADYRVPQVLVHFGSIKYSDDLLDLLEKDTILANGQAEEVEIRGASIYVVEKLKEIVLEEIKEKNLEIAPKNVNSILLDHFLWDYRRKFAKELEYIPFHKTISIYY